MKILRKILFPLSLAYGGVMLLRNFLYEKEVLNSNSFSFPVITVGNLSVGGTGKTPMIEYLINLLLPHYRVAVLSRGYGRRTKGYIELNGTETPLEVGDEPLQFKRKYPKAVVAVCEDRVLGIEGLVENYSPDLILLDDAYQHRKVEAGYNILLTTFNDLYVNDHVLPAGNLREPVAGAKRADTIIVTKCPEDLKPEQQERIRKRLKILPTQKLFFSYIKYGDKLYNKEKEISIPEIQKRAITLVTGIANPKPLCRHLERINIDYTHLEFPDHHHFTYKDLQVISQSHFILTTEKDYMRLKELSHPHIYYMPIKVDFINSGENLQKDILQYIANEK